VPERRGNFVLFLSSSFASNQSQSQSFRSSGQDGRAKKKVGSWLQKSETFFPEFAFTNFGRSDNSGGVAVPCHAFA
jgi:hypothetical protein